MKWNKKKNQEVDQTVLDQINGVDSDAQNKEASEEPAVLGNIEEYAEEKPVKKKKSKKKKWLIILAVVIILMIIIGNVVGSMAKSGPMAVTVAKAENGDIEEELNYSGTVMTEETKTYFAPVSGKIASVDVASGDKVKTGDPLMSYDLESLEEASTEAALSAKAEGYGIDATQATIQKSQQDQAKAAKDYDEAIAYVNHYSACLESANAQYNDAMAVKTEYDTLKATVDQYKIQQGETPEENPELTKLITDGEARLAELTNQMAQYDYTALAGAIEICSNDMNAYKAQAEQFKAGKEVNPSLASQSAQQATLEELNKMSKEKATKDLETAKNGVNAEFTGVVTEVTAVEGQTAPEGTQLFVLQNLDALKVTVEVTKYDLAQIQVGQKATITINGKEYTGSVSKVNGMAQVNASGASVVTADIHIDNPDETLYLGIEAKVKIQCESKKDVLLVPIECVNYDTQGSFCYVVEDGLITRKEVEVGISSDTMIQIAEGLKKGDQVISDNTGELTEGMEVTPVEAVEE